MKRTLMLLMLSISILTNAGNKKSAQLKENLFRAPAVPLITSDPYFSVWSAGDKLNEVSTSHWTGKTQPLIGVIRVDGKTFRFLGQEETVYAPVLPTATTGTWEASYVEKDPEAGWNEINFNDDSWKKGRGDFSTREKATYGTAWDTRNIWVRRSFNLKEDLSAQPLFLEYSNDDDIEIYINGVKVVDTGNNCNRRKLLELDTACKKLLKPGKNLIAAHCLNRVGDGYVDFGLLKRIDNTSVFETKAIQKSVAISATQTRYLFDCGPVQLGLVFTAPLLMNDLDLISTPVNYISYDVRSLDKKKHDVQVYFETTPQLAVNSDNQPVRSERIKKDKLTFLKTGTINQPILGQSGDDVRIDWGYLYLGGQLSATESLELGESDSMKRSFLSTGELIQSVDPRTLPANMKEKMTVLAYSNKLGAVSREPVRGHFMIGYDDVSSIRYFYEDLLPYWKHNGTIDIFQAFEKAEKSYPDLITRCNDFDRQLNSDAEKAGGKEYAQLCALAYRQAIAAHKLVQDKNGNLLFLSKENNSGGFINTVDVTYPSAPLFLLYNPELLEGMLNPNFYYSESGRWTKPFPAHDLGNYPIANGQNYGEDMPVEEAGNMLLLTTAIAAAEGNADYARKHWDVMSVWVDYLLQAGLNPENQLCTDDFAGHIAHNTNLSVKAILGIAGYGKMAAMLGKEEVAAKYTHAARDMAKKWTAMAHDGDHYRLTFDRPGTWSQKYNLVWDKVLDLGIFPQEVARQEVAYYLKNQNKYGLPLDSRKTYTKSDWILWTACLANTPEGFRQLITPVYKYANETASRVPLSDWHETTDGTFVGFKARSVVGGYFMKMLEDKMLNKK
ncbi:MAG: DUF4965 domain-containing protein [Bacteroidota bacterium]|nr:DUF4965 domain-containing protein [Bacteroidota bacterium]